MLKKIAFTFFTLMIAFQITPMWGLTLNNCLKCHHVESIGPNHNFSCIKCHVFPNRRRKKITSHQEIIDNPSSLKYVSVLCIRCHRKDIYNIRHSLHGTLAGAIAITRYTWGAQRDLAAHYGVIGAGSVKPLPTIYTKHAHSPKALVNNFLRRKCLRCHLLNNGTDNGAGAPGTYRARGCAACHMRFNPYGTYDGTDTVMRGKSVFSETHKFLKTPPMRNCLSCHNTEFVGTDYIGWFPHDYPYSFNSPILSNGRFPTAYYGIEFHHLISDVHYRAGLTCTDCHGKAGVMGDGRIYNSEEEKGAIKISCYMCHGGFSKHPAKWAKKWHTTPFNPTIPPHRSYHSKVSCSACHSAWQNENYGFNVFLDMKPDYPAWKNVTSQEDPYLQSFLNRAIHLIEEGKSPPKPTMPDRITEKMYPGIWLTGWIMRRWSFFTLGETLYGEFKILRPLFEYVVSYRDKEGRIILNSTEKTKAGRIMSAFLPYDPHTITLHGKSCEACHNNPLIKPGREKHSVMRLLWGPVLYGHPLSNKVLNKLHSTKYKTIRARMLKLKIP